MSGAMGMSNAYESVDVTMNKDMTMGTEHVHPWEGQISTSFLPSKLAFFVICINFFFTNKRMD